MHSVQGYRDIAYNIQLAYRHKIYCTGIAYWFIQVINTSTVVVQALLVILELSRNYYYTHIAIAILHCWNLLQHRRFLDG